MHQSIETNTMHPPQVLNHGVFVEDPNVETKTFQYIADQVPFSGLTTAPSNMCKVVLWTVSERKTHLGRQIYSWVELQMGL